MRSLVPPESSLTNRHGRQKCDSKYCALVCDKPTIASHGEFGILLEDCLCVTSADARLFTPQSPSIDNAA